MTTRRSFILGTASLLVAPAIVRAGSLMPVKVLTQTSRDVIVAITLGMEEGSMVVSWNGQRMKRVEDSESQVAWWAPSDYAPLRLNCGPVDLVVVG